LAIFRPHLKSTAKIAGHSFLTSQPIVELVIPVMIPSEEHRRRRLVSVSNSTQEIDNNEIVGNEDRQVCVVDLLVVSISTEYIDSDLLDIKQSSRSKAKEKGTAKENPDIIVTNLEMIHDSFPKNYKIVGVTDRKVIEQVEASTSFFLVRMWIY